MKRSLIILGLILVVGIGSAFAYADSSKGEGFGFGPRGVNNEEMEQWHQERMEWRKKDLEEGVKRGYISEEEAKNWEEHYDYMDEFHRENGYGGCHGPRGMGMMRGGHHRGYNSQGMGMRMGW